MTGDFCTKKKQNLPMKAFFFLSTSAPGCGTFVGKLFIMKENKRLSRIIEKIRKKITAKNVENFDRANEKRIKTNRYLSMGHSYTALQSSYLNFLLLCFFCNVLKLKFYEEKKKEEDKEKLFICDFFPVFCLRLCLIDLCAVRRKY